MVDPTVGGNEEQLDQYSHEIQPEFYRNAIEVSKRTLHFNAADLTTFKTDMCELTGVAYGGVGS